MIDNKVICSHDAIHKATRCHASDDSSNKKRITADSVVTRSELRL